MTQKQIANRLHSFSHPLVYEVNTRVLVNELSVAAQKPVTLATIPDRVIDEWASLGFDAVWLMGVWSTGKLGQEIAQQAPNLQQVYRAALPDYTEDDVIGSPYAVKAHTVSARLGGKTALLALRKRLEKRGVGLVLDYLCNHTARDCRWVFRHPEYYVQGLPGEDQSMPEYYFRTKTVKGDRVLAFGRDPYFPGWTDTAQLNLRHPGARQAQVEALEAIAALCDGVRCDMAMLVLDDVFGRTWGARAQPEGVEAATGEFWEEAISAVRRKSPMFVFIAEAYWNLEWRLQRLGFRFTYDKTLYDRLLREGASSVYDHLKAELSFQRHSVRFIENHDERRAAQALSTDAWHFAAATVAATVPGMSLFHDGQLEGRKIKLPVQLGRRAAEPELTQVHSFYKRLLSCLRTPVFQKGEWRLLTIKPAWHANRTWPNFLAFWWEEPTSGARLVVVNYAPQSGQCHVDLHLDSIQSSTIELRDLMSEDVYVRERSALQSKGMYFDLPGYGFHIFDVRPVFKPTFQ